MPADSLSTDSPSLSPLRVRLRLKAGDRLVFGPGRLQILEGIAETGSIAAAARTMDMSYRRAWLLVDDINRCFQSPLVESVAGGKRGGGARLTELGQQVIACYRDLLRHTEEAIAAEKAFLHSVLANPLPSDKPADKGTGKAEGEGA